MLYYIILYYVIYNTIFIYTLVRPYSDKPSFQACVAAGHDTSPLNIIVPAVPTAQPCDAGLAPAGCA